MGQQLCLRWWGQVLESLWRLGHFRQTLGKESLHPVADTEHWRRGPLCGLQVVYNVKGLLSTFHLYEGIAPSIPRNNNPFHFLPSRLLTYSLASGLLRHAQSRTDDTAKGSCTRRP